MSNPSLSNLLYETRRFDPPEDLTANANVKADADSGLSRGGLRPSCSARYQEAVARRPLS